MAESALGATFVVGFNPTVVSASQDRTMVRTFRDALFPRLLFRGDAAPEKWGVNLGTNMTFSRASLMRPSTRPLTQNADPTPKSWDVEQWEVNAKQYGDAIDTHMPTNYVTLASIYLRNMHQLGLQAGMSMNRIPRDKIYNAYTAGNTVTSAAVGGGTAVPVVSINGFTHVLVAGRPTPVSAAAPLPITITTGGVTTAYNVVAVTPTAAGDLIHGGTLTIDVAHAGLAARDFVLADNRSLVINSGGSVSIDGITAGDQFTLADIRAGVAQLRSNNAPVHEDGTYHCHLDPTSESQIFGDNEFQRLNQSIPDYTHYREMAIASLLGTTFYRNTETPNNATVDQDPNYGFTYAPEIFNATGVEIHRPIMTAAGHLEEKYLDEAKYISEAGVMGKIGELSVVNNGMQVMAERIRLILRAPLDRLQQQTSAAWSWSGDYGIPTDSGNLTGPADFKRAVVFQHG